MSSATSASNMDIVTAVEDLSGYASRELNILLKDADNFTIQHSTAKGSLRQIDMERLSSCLPLHLIAVLMSPDMEMPLVHLLRGVRLLHALSDLASRHTRLEQIMLDDVRFSEQILDMVFFMLIVLARYEQGKLLGTSLPFLHSALVAGTLHLLPCFISSQWHDLVHVLLTHPKVEIFMDIAYDAVHVDIRFLHIKLSTLSNDVLCNKLSCPAAERTVHFLCQQCEASLQLLLSLYQQKMFRDRVFNNEELCTNGGILSLARSALKLHIPESFKECVDIVAAVSRIKSKVLANLLQLCEAEKIVHPNEIEISYLDVVAGSSKSMHLARSVASEIVDLLKVAFRIDAKVLSDSFDRSVPKGLVLLNSLRLADVLSDDSNFRLYFMTNIIEVLVEILAIPHEEFLSSWCAVDIPVIEEDTNVEYDPFTAAGVALISFTDGCENASVPVLLNETSSACPSATNGSHSITYAQQKTSYLVKIIANFHCFNPVICKGEDINLFLNKFHQCLLVANQEACSRYPPNPDAVRAATIYKNLNSLSNYAASLVPSLLLNDQDVELLRQFSDQLQNLNPQQVGANWIQEPFLKDMESTMDYKREDSHLLQPWSKFQDSDSNEMSQGVQSTVGISASSSGQESDQFIVKSKSIIADDSELAKNRRNASGSFRGFDKENQNTEIEGREHNSKADVHLRPPDKESGFQEYDKAERLGEEKQPRKRKRNIMNQKQIFLIEEALVEEPEMQRNQPSLQAWADKLSAQGSEITPNQLKNWVNNRKARLARAARENQAPSEGENTYLDKPCGANTSQYYDSPESAGEDFYNQSSSRGGNTQLPQQPKLGGVMTRAASSLVVDHSLEPDQLVVVVDAEGKEVGKGKVFQVKGRWHGRSLEDRATCILDVVELKIEKCRGVQHPSEDTGTTFEEAEARNSGVMRVAWDSDKILPLA